MYRRNPKFRRSLNADQIRTLAMLYSYRFGSNELISEYFSKKDMYRQLRLLEVRGLLNRRYEHNYKLIGRPAAYYVSASAVRLLKELDSKTIFVPEYAYRSRNVTEQFIDHSFDILNVSNRISKYGYISVIFFTKVDLNIQAYDYFPKPLPDAYIQISDSKVEKQFFLNLYKTNHPLFVIVRWLKQYVSYLESARWNDTGTDIPVLLIIVESHSVWTKLVGYIDSNLHSVSVYTTTRDRMLTASQEDRIWHRKGVDHRFEDLLLL